MQIPGGCTARQRITFSDWLRGRRPLTQEQIAAWMRTAWATPPAYTVTAPGDPQQAAATWALAARRYLARHQGWLATAAPAATARARRWSFPRLRRSA